MFFWSEEEDDGRKLEVDAASWPSDWSTSEKSGCVKSPLFGNAIVGEGNADKEVENKDVGEVSEGRKGEG